MLLLVSALLPSDSGLFGCRECRAADAASTSCYYSPATGQTDRRAATQCHHNRLVTHAGWGTLAGPGERSARMTHLHGAAAVGRSCVSFLRPARRPVAALWPNLAGTRPRGRPEPLPVRLPAAPPALVPTQPARRVSRLGRGAARSSTALCVGERSVPQARALSLHRLITAAQLG